MSELITRKNGNITEVWTDITEYVKGAMESTVERVEILIMSDETVNATFAEARRQEIINNIAEQDDLCIVCESMHITFNDGRTITIKNK